MATIKQHREALQDLLVSGVLTSVQAQVISLVYFANKKGYKPVDGDIRKGFKVYFKEYGDEEDFISLQCMQFWYNCGCKRPHDFDQDCMIVEELGLVYHKRTTREISSQKEYLKFNF